MLLSYQVLAYFFAAIIIYLTLLKPIISYLRDPLDLRKYPAPSFIAASTPFWLIRATWSQDRSRIIHEELKRLGDVVRVSPDHLIFNDPAAIKDIYGVLAISRGVAKDEFYDRLAGDAHDLVQIRDRGEHSGRRKAIANAFAAKTVVNMESVIRKAFLQLLVGVDRSIDESTSGKEASINLRRWLNLFTLDVIGDTGFGTSMGFLREGQDFTTAESQDGAKYEVKDMIDTLHRGVRYSLTMANIPSLRLGRLLRYIVTKSRPLASEVGSIGAEDFENICIHKLRTRMQQGPPGRESGDFMTFILGEKSHASKPDEENTFTHTQFRSLVADSQMMMNAGSDTTAAALTSTIWFLIKNPHALSRLRDELKPLMTRARSEEKSAEASIFSYESVKDLPYLRACIDESLRLRPPIAYQLPRLVSRPVKIAGHDILPGTVVAVAPYSVHRHPSLYRDPDEYRPERWVDFDASYPEQRDNLKKYNIVFSQGSRACIGRHLAIVELQILVSTLVMRYEMDLTEESAKELRVYERFNSNPGPMTLIIRERRVPDISC